MLSKLLVAFALVGFSSALPNGQDEAELEEGTIAHLIPNSGWMKFPFGNVGSETKVDFNLYCPGIMNITDLYCSGDRFEIFDNGKRLGDTSRPVFNNCSSNSSDPNYTQRHHQWSSDSFKLMPGHHEVIIKVIKSPYRYGTGAIRVDTYKEHHKDHRHPEPCPCSLDVCPHHTQDLVVVRTEVPRCEAESVCRSLGLHLADINIENFMEATTLAFKCSGPNSQTWIDDWNGDRYHGSCLVLSTGSAAPGGAINVPSCCSARMPVFCQKKASHHPFVRYDCNKCQSSCYCKPCQGLDCHDRHPHDGRKHDSRRRHGSSRAQVGPADDRRRSRSRSRSQSSTESEKSGHGRDGDRHENQWHHRGEHCKSCRYGECHQCKSCGLLRAQE